MRNSDSARGRRGDEAGTKGHSGAGRRACAGCSSTFLKFPGVRTVCRSRCHRFSRLCRRDLMQDGGDLIDINCGLQGSSRIREPASGELETHSADPAMGSTLRVGELFLYPLTTLVCLVRQQGPQPREPWKRGDRSHCRRPGQRRHSTAGMGRI